MNILVTDGNNRATLAITRTLGEKGHHVYVSSNTDTSLSGASKYCYQNLVYPDPVVDTDGFLDSIEDLIERHRIDVLMPASDICVLPIAEHRSRFEPHCIVPLPSSDSIHRAADKHDITSLAADLDVPIPKTLTVESPEQDIVSQLPAPFPLVIKPSRSRVPVDGGWVHTSVDFANSLDELQSKLRDLPREIFPVLVQERVRGPGIGVFYCFDRGKLVTTFAHRRIREKPPSGGVSVLRESVTPHAQALEFGVRLLESLDWHGVAMVEFKLDQHDQIPKLMEINGRFWGSLQLAIDAGVDFPDLLLRSSTGETVQPCSEYKLGVRTRWLWGEIDLLLMYLFKSRKELNLPDGHESRLKSITKILNPFVRNQKLEVLRLSDLRPWLYETRHWFGR